MVVVVAREGEGGLARADEAVRVAVVVVREAEPDKVEGERADARLLTRNAQAAREARRLTLGNLALRRPLRRTIEAQAVMGAAWPRTFSLGRRGPAVSMAGLLLDTEGGRQADS